MKKNIDKSVLQNRFNSFLISALRYALLIAVGYIVLLPVFTMVTYAFKDVADVFDQSVIWVPKHFTLDNIKRAYERLNYWSSFGNTIYIEIVSAFIQLCTAAITAYAFARFNFKFKKILYAFLMLTILIPTPMIIVSLYGNFSNFSFLGINGLLEKVFNVDLTPNLLNTPLTFYLPALLSIGLKSGLSIFIFMQFFKGLPKELEEAASIDGAGVFKTFATVILPSSGTAVLTVTIFSVIWHWNDYYLITMYYSEGGTLARVLPGAFSYDYGSLTVALDQMAGCLLFILPLLIFYLILQRKFVQSIDSVGIVG